MRCRYLRFRSTNLCEQENVSISRVYQQTALFDNGRSFILVSSDNPEVFGKSASVSLLPEGNGAVISKLVARSLSLDVGDSFSVNLEGKSIELKVSEIVDRYC